MDKNKQILGMPWWLWMSAVIVSLACVVIGSFVDLQFSQMIFNPTAFGKFVQDNGCMVAFAMPVIAGMCLYKGLKRLDKPFFAWLLLFAGLIGPVVKYYDFLVGYVQTGSVAFDYVVSIVCALVFYGAILLIASKIVSSENAKDLIVVGSIIFAGCLLVLGTTTLLKFCASRPRYRFLISAENTDGTQFAAWWQWNFGTSAQMGDGFKSFPSGHIANSCMLLTLPLVVRVTKKDVKYWRILSFIVAFLFVLGMAFNRLLMGAHFLSDVGFAFFEALCIYAFVELVVNKIYIKIVKNTNTRVG